MTALNQEFVKSDLRLCQKWANDVRNFDTKFLQKESFETYKAQSEWHLTSHGLMDFIKSPALYHQKRQGLVPAADSPAFAFGRAAHTLILEGEHVFHETYAIGGPINPRTGRTYGTETIAFQDWAEKQGRECLSREQHDQLVEMADSVASHPIAPWLLSNGVAEGVARGCVHNVPCQVRIDWFSVQHGIVDLKTCADLDRFETDFYLYNYDLQLAFYAMLMEQCIELLSAAHIVAVEKQAPYRCGVWMIEPLDLAKMIDKIEVHLDRFRSCQQTDVWPTDYEHVRFLSARKQ